MAKKQELMTAPSTIEESNLALLGDEGYLPVIDFEETNLEITDLAFNRAVIYQGTVSKKYYGDHEDGAVVDGGSMQTLKDTHFVVLWPTKCYRAYLPKAEGGGKIYEYLTAEQVPAGDFEWAVDPVTGKKTPPRCQQSVAWAVVFAGKDSPLILEFKFTNQQNRNAHSELHKSELARSTALRAAIVHAQRSKSKLVPPASNLYELTTTTASNDQGEWYVPVVRRDGEAPKEMIEVGKHWAVILGQGKKVVRAKDEEDNAPAPTASKDEVVPNDTPF